RTSCPNRIPVISKLALVLDIYSRLSLIWRYSYCLVFQGATSDCPEGYQAISSYSQQGAEEEALPLKAPVPDTPEEVQIQVHALMDDIAIPGNWSHQ
ncbi:hypothetical protein, partial [Enterobacter asburiae]|uniref:hypothetical protein n=1 Tax=Enterobacter asburiae TaxID=61645 RepID=UPI001D10216D